MPNIVVDTNVLLCASAADADSLFHDASHVTAEEQLEVLTWLSAFRVDPERLLVLDESGAIYDEYRNKLSDQDFGLLAIHDKMGTSLYVPVDFDDQGHGVIPAELHALDRSDRKLAAAAIGAAILDGGSSTVANATDTDWYEVEVALLVHGVVVQQLLPEYCRAKYDEKKARSAP